MTKKALFLGGVSVKSEHERELAFFCGKLLGTLKYSLLHGGYNGLMEEVARGAATEDASIFAITLLNKDEWGGFNPFVKKAFFYPDLGQRLNSFFMSTNVVIAMGGGVGTLHEIASAIWYAGNIRRMPIIILGARAKRLITFLQQEEWLYKSSTRPLDFLYFATSKEELRSILSVLENQKNENQIKNLEKEVFDSAFITGKYTRADGTNLNAYFNPFLLSSNPSLLLKLANLIASKIDCEIDSVAGIALGGVTLATYVALLLGKPLLIIRPLPKNYGTYAQVEGEIKQGSRVLIVDDVVRQGSALITAQKALKYVGLNANNAACVLCYGNLGVANLIEHQISLSSLYFR